MDQASVDKIKVQRDALAAENKVLREKIDRLRDALDGVAGMSEEVSISRFARAALTKEATNG